MYGFTQDPETKDYYIVLQYANDLDLHRYLVHNCASIDWWQRISILDGIVKGIHELHKADLIHHNLHTGNILVRRNTRRKEVERMSLRNPSSSVKIWISDSGLQGPAGSSSNENNDKSSSSSPIDENSNIISNSRKGIYGVLPYIAPEVLQGKEYTKSSDIYSLGIIMWELSNGATLKRQQRYKRPFHDQPYDKNLAKEIVINEIRPNTAVSPDIPECWLDLMKKCWASKPEDRPNIEDIMTTTNAWNAERRKSLNLESKSSLLFSLSHGDHNIDENVVGQFMEAEKRRIERLNKGKQVERDDKSNVEGEISVSANESVNQDDDDNHIHQEVSMKSQLIDFVIEIPNENLNEIYGHVGIEKEKVDSGYQREDQDDESLELKENINQLEDEIEPEKTIEEEKNLNKNIEGKNFFIGFNALIKMKVGTNFFLLYYQINKLNQF